jgi:hypothetical protein
MRWLFEKRDQFSEILIEHPENIDRVIRGLSAPHNGLLKIGRLSNSTLPPAPCMLMGLILRRAQSLWNL